MANYNTYRIYNRKTNDWHVPKRKAATKVVTERILDAETGEVSYKEVATEIQDIVGYWHLPGSNPDTNHPSRFLEIEGKAEYDEFIGSKEAQELVRLGIISTEKMN